MNAKSIALLIVGMVLVSSVFFIFHVSYPANPATIQFQHPPKNIKPPKYQIFQNQTFNQPRLGQNQTSFTPSGNTSMILEGYVYNGSSPGKSQPLANQVLGIAVMQALTLVTTNSQGFYQVKILVSGQGTFAYKAFQYETAYETLYIGQGISVLTENVSLTPQTKYSVSGLTESHGQNVSGVSLIFTNFWGKYYSSSGTQGNYAVNMVDGNYTISDVKSGFGDVPSPYSVNVSNANISPYNIDLNSTNKAIFYMNGYLFNRLGNRISGALIYDSSTSSVSNSSNFSLPSGFYNISVEYSLNAINVINALGYTQFAKNVNVYHNLSNENFTLDALDPFSGTTGITGNAPSGLGNNISRVYYNNPSSISISGHVISAQTNVPVPNQQFTLYTSVNGTYFYDTVTTNSSGYYQVNLQFPGNFHINVTSLQFYDTWLNQSLSHSQNNVNIYVYTSPNKVYHISGGVINGLTNTSLSNATITVYSKGGGILTTVQANATGQFNLSLLGGSYKIGISKAGFNTTYLNTTLTGNTTGLTVPVTPTSSIANGSNVWHSTVGSGVPGVNGSAISGLINSTANSAGSSPGTTSATPVLLTIKMVDNATNTSIDNTAYEMFINVNGLTLNLTGSTNATGYSSLDLAYGGTYILLPEMLDYSGIAKFVNTSQYNGKVLDLYLNPLPVYKVSLTLANPLSGYNGDNVPSSGLSVSGYALPITGTSSPGTNYTLFQYILPNGTYNFQYSNISYVKASFPVNVTGSAVNVSEYLSPYVVSLSWNTPVTWKYSLSGPGAPGGSTTGNAGTSMMYIPLQNGAYSFSAYLGANVVSTRAFSLTAKAPESPLHFTASEHNLTQTGLKSVYYNFNTSVLQVNTSFNQSQVYYISQVGINANLSSSSDLYIDSRIAGTLTANSTIITVPNYFATSSSGQTNISIVSNSFNDYKALYNFAKYGANVTITYYTADLTG